MINILKKSVIFMLTRTKTSIRYAKENAREKRERKKGRRRDIERNVRPLLTECRSDKSASTLNRVKISLMCVHSKQSVDLE